MYFQFCSAQLSQSRSHAHSRVPGFGVAAAAIVSGAAQHERPHAHSRTTTQERFNNVKEVSTRYSQLPGQALCFSAKHNTSIKEVYAWH